MYSCEIKIRRVSLKKCSLHYRNANKYVYGTFKIAPSAPLPIVELPLSLTTRSFGPNYSSATSGRTEAKHWGLIGNMVEEFIIFNLTYDLV